jgi:hypothetical protein
MPEAIENGAIKLFQELLDGAARGTLNAEGEDYWRVSAFVSLIIELAVTEAVFELMKRIDQRREVANAELPREKVGSGDGGRNADQGQKSESGG